MLEGFYRDRLCAADGGVLADSGWRHNTIALNAWPLIAGLLRGDPAMHGVQFCAVGEGSAAWDQALPTVDPAAPTLTRELARIAVGAQQITYLDGSGQPTNQMTARFEAVAAFSWNAPQTLREFGLFGGDATETANSGQLVNHVVHSAVKVKAGQTLTRRIRLSFRPPLPRSAAAPPKTSGTIASMPMTVVDGVGKKVADALDDLGVATIRDVSRLTSGQPVPGLSATQIVELRAKARLALQTAPALPAFSTLDALEVQEVLGAVPSELAEQTRVPLDAVQALQDQLGMLQVALDARKLKHMTVAELRG